MTRELRDLKVVLTGAGRGIGRAIAETFAECGARLALMDLAPESLEETRSGLTNASAHHLTALDVQDRGAVEAAVDGAVQALGGVDVLINNAGVRAFRSIKKLDADIMRHHFDVNVLGTMNMMLATANHMEATGGGRIINLTSIVAVRPMVDNAAYSASKAALQALSVVAAHELGPLGISVTCLAPGPTTTALTADALDDPTTRDAWLSRMPIGRVGTPHDVARAALYLATDSFTTGTTLYVDGGYSAS